jgi:GNAT superfamily N-acetyltransferase
MIDPRLKENVVRALEERALRAWPALQTAPCAGWVLRYAKGFTKRANSANAIAPSAPFHSVRPLVEIFYRSHHLPVTFRLTPLAGAGTDEALAAADYRLLDPTVVMVSRLQADRGDVDGVELSAHPGPEWRQGFAEAKGVPAASRAVHDRIVGAISADTAFATVRDCGRPVAFGLAVADRGVLGLFDVVVAERARRRGLGRQVAAALLAWGRDKGAMGAYLQVIAANEPAMALYRGLGFEDAYRYHYRVKD